jgi:DNA-binding Xre family transcriptional regulator
VVARNVGFKAKEVEKLTKERFEAITAEDWLKICEHVDKIVAEH